MSMIIRKDNLPDIDIDTTSFIYEGDFILIQDEYICDILKLLSVVEITFANFTFICFEGYFKDYPEVLELYTLESAHNVYWYASVVLKGRFELGEPIIATNAYYSYMYANSVLKGRFELGEPAIATNVNNTYWYAHNVLKGRFELGESAILNSKYADQYREKFLCQ